MGTRAPRSEMSKFRLITQETLLPLSLIGVIGYVIFFVGSYANRIVAAEGNISDLQKFQLDNGADHKLILAKLGRIEGLLEKQRR